MPIRHPLLTLAVTGLLTFTSAPAALANDLSAQEFVTKASIANMFEVESSKLALEKTENDDVKAFAEQMVKDHTATGDKLVKTLKSANSAIKPSEKLDEKHQDLINTLKKASGQEFDKEYVSIQTDAHKEAVSLFSDYAEKGEKGDIRGFAEETLPALKAHLAHVEQLSVQ